MSGTIDAAKLRLLLELVRRIDRRKNRAEGMFVSKGASASAMASIAVGLSFEEGRVEELIDVFEWVTEESATDATFERFRGNVKLCACGATIRQEDGVGWVDTLSGDDGGTYDLCPATGDTLNFGAHEPEVTA